jgi:hypothetical protein
MKLIQPTPSPLISSESLVPIDGCHQPDTVVSTPESSEWRCGRGNSEESKYWDLSFFEQRDPLAWMYTHQIRNLAVRFEFVMTEADISVYRIVQNHLNYTFGCILGQKYATSKDAMMEQDSEIRVLLNALYGEVIEKMNSILA